ncbi:MAG: hypothetical protein H7833_13900 [Magnetococcus sp. DMHC-1]|nr:hypothetical protein [Magnetococcales bacterium]
MFRKYRTLPTSKTGFPLADGEEIRQQTILHVCVYLVPFFLGLVAAIFLALVQLKVIHNFYYVTDFSEFAYSKSPPLRMVPLARFAVTGLFFSTLAAAILFVRAMWRREFTRLTLTSRQVVLQTRARHPQTRSWSLAPGTTLTVRHHPWKLSCYSALVIRDGSGHETTIAPVRDAEIFQKTAHRVLQEIST